ncbi:MFS transporter [Steroidobacter agaridevorans]|uniref:MFS transporter n=1 Tax=Steroidobacter agaridevorans TaxID=2695856 RepID=A0A829YKB7_9GAMM|nr:MFS transporter [Steroidobacter agaridevorans]GFE83228.1 MFS transporter [Steroidobacter agaridevorans]
MIDDAGEYRFKPHERPMMPGSPASPDHPTPRRVGYFLIGVLIGITGAMGNALVSANLQNIQGALGLYSDQAAWMTTVYTMTNVSMSLLLVKFRQQFGLVPFVRIFLTAYIVLTAAHVFVHEYSTSLIVRAASGIAASALSTLGLLYMVQSMPAAHRLKGIVLGIGIPQLATPLARLFSSDLLELGQWRALYIFELGLSILCLAAVVLLRLPPSERMKAFEKLDFVTFALYAPGVALLCAFLGLGRVLWWTEAPWLGYVLCGAIVLIATALLIEHNRANPLLNTRWMGSALILRFAFVATTVRVLLSEQTFGAIGLLTALGINNDQLFNLFVVISIVTAIGIAASALTVNPANLGRPIFVSVALIAIGAFIDAHATNLTRPANMYISQSLIAFAAVYFMGPTLLIGILQAMARGPNHIVSFSAVFSISQSLGGLAGSAFLGSFQIVREKFHSHAIVQSLTLTDPQVAARLQTLRGAYGGVVTDPTLRSAEGAALLSQQVTREANVLAFNDVFLTVCVLACLTLLWIGARQVRMYITGENPMTGALAAIAKKRAQQQ